jgi:hypothetical protein
MEQIGPGPDGSAAGSGMNRWRTACGVGEAAHGMKKQAVSYAVEIVAYGEAGHRSRSGLRFGTRMEAEAYVRDLARRWTLVVATRVVESEEPPNLGLLGRKTVARA